MVEILIVSVVALAGYRFFRCINDTAANIDCTAEYIEKAQQELM